MPYISDVCKSNLIPNKNFNAKSSNFAGNPNSKPNIKYNNNNLGNPEEHVRSDFRFQYISKPELEAVIKRVRRSKQKQRDEEEWKCFLQQRKSKDSNICSVCNLRGPSNCARCGLPEPCIISESNINQQSQGDEEEILKDNESIDTIISVPKIAESCEDPKTSHTYQLSPGLVKRLQDLLSTISKMTTLLLNPGLYTQHEDEDVDRTIKRSLEFDAMFTRNHLYEIQRLLKDTKQLIRSANMVDLETKIAAALKCVIQALQVYMKHVSKGSRIKYQQVVPIFQSITSIEILLEHLTSERLFPMRQELDVSCSYLKQLLLETSTTETKSMSVASRKVQKDPLRRKPSTDLSMYNRRGRDWRHKSAVLARQRFGPPLYKNRHKFSGSVTCKGKVDAKLNTGAFKKDPGGQLLSGKLCDKSVLSKEVTKSKDVPFRNATRAVPEEQVTTMMEMIPHEPSDGSELCLGESDFQALKLLNGTQAPVQENKVVCFQKSSSRTKRREVSGNTNSPKSSAKEICNVQLVCLTEEAPQLSHLLAHEETIVPEDDCTTLNVESKTKEEAEEYRQKIIDYNNSNPHYKDGKAIEIVDRLANQILSEMILDFQRDEVDQVVKILYDWEFQ